MTTNIHQLADDHLVAFHYLGDPFGRHKRPSFNISDPGIRQAPDELKLCIQSYDLRLILQSISWSYFHDSDFPRMLSPRCREGSTTA